jgi:hypothetical protein
MTILIEDRNGARRGNRIRVDRDDGRGLRSLQQVLLSLQRHLDQIHHTIRRNPAPDHPTAASTAPRPSPDP